MKKTLVIGASENPERYSNKAVRSLRNHGHEVVAIGTREGKIDDVSIHTAEFPAENIDTVSLYVGPQHQDDYAEYILRLKPRRVIFNPGTENPALEENFKKAGIEATEACTLVLLSTGQY